VLVEGAAGMGKSRLLDHARQAAARRGVRTAAAAATEPGRLVPVAPLLEALGVALATAPAGIADTRLWLLEQLRTHLVERAMTCPLLLVLDDLQWADPATLFAVRNLAGQLESYPVLWLLAGRRDAARDPFGRFCTQIEQLRGADTVRLAPLSAEAAAEVVGDVAGGVPESDLMALAAQAEHNPFLLIELVDGLQAARAVEIAHGRARLVDARVPCPLPPIAALRLDRLTTDTRQVLQVAAVVGLTFSLKDLAEVLDEPFGRLLPTMREALNLDVVVPSGQTASFRHDLVRRAAHEELPEAFRVALYREIGMLLLRRGSSALLAASYLLYAPRPGDHDALAGLDQAVGEARTRWPPMAPELALRALEFTQPDDEDRFTRRVTTVDALAAGGRLDEAIELARGSLGTAVLPRRHDAQLWIRLSRMLFMGGDIDHALAAAEAVFDQPDLADLLYTEAELIRLRCLTAHDNFRAARQPAEAILAGGERPGADAALGAAVATLGFIAWNEAHVADAFGHLRGAVQRAESAPAEVPRIYTNLMLGLALTAIGHFDEAQATMHRCREVIEQLGDTLWVPAAPICLGRAHAAAGRLDDAVAEAQVGLTLAEEFGIRLMVPPALSVLASIALSRGQLDEAGRLVARYRRELLAGREWGFGAMFYDWIEVRLADARQDAARSRTLLNRICDALSVHKRLLVDEPAAAGWLVRAALAVGDRARAELVVHHAEQVAADNRDFPSFMASFAHGRGLLYRNAAALQQAAADHRQPWACASAAEDVAVILADGNREAARVWLEHALATYEGAGADRDAARVRTRLHLIGAHARRVSTRSAPSWDMLTDTEHRVIELVAKGLTNRQVGHRLFMSHHTVDFHLGRVFRQLDVNSRGRTDQPQD
jgi:DNA-binding CsgD family transcriptional regulator